MVTQSSHYTLSFLLKQENSWLEWSDLNIGLSGRLEGGVKGVQNLGWMYQGVTGLTLAPDLTLIFSFYVVCSALFKLQCPLRSCNCPSVILFWRSRQSSPVLPIVLLPQTVKFLISFPEPWTSEVPLKQLLMWYLQMLTYLVVDRKSCIHENGESV